MSKDTTAARSLEIELLRTGMDYNHVLSPDEKYLALCGSHPPSNFTVSLIQKEFNDYVKQLRYGNQDKAAVEAARTALEKVVRGIFEGIPMLPAEAKGDGWLHLRLIIMPRELGLLPFEFSLTPKGLKGEGDKPLLLNPERRTTITREIRQTANRGYVWPTIPRVLFAWASPGRPVPHDGHRDKLLEILRPWMRPLADNAEPVPNSAPWFCELANASLDDIREEIKKKPYTHVHILAHGTDILDDDGRHFALALCKQGSTKEMEAVDGTALASALAPEGSEVPRPAVVTVSACDSSNDGTPILPGASLAHALHNCSIPYVLGSQFPLTQKGSVELVGEFYPRLFCGEDPRTALSHAREALHRFDPSAHDWASLVAYARFPEDLEHQLAAVELAVVLESMKTANAWTDHVLKHGAKTEKTLGEVETRLDKAIKDLKELLGLPPEGFIPQDSGQAKDPVLYPEHLGLLGSAYKRKAEHLYRLVPHRPEQADGLRAQSVLAVEEARQWYGRGHDEFLAHHWTGCQYLSLTAVLKGTLVEELQRWAVVEYSAKKDLNDPKQRMWALGTMAEMHLLRPLTLPPGMSEATEQGALETAKTYLNELAEKGSAFEKESTTRQLERYMTWWPAAFPSDGMKRLQAMASELRKILPPL